MDIVRTVLSVENPSWSNEDHSILTATVLFEELEGLGPIPFSTSADADTEHGRYVWDNALKNEYGPIADFVPPTADERRASMPPLTAKQFRLGMRRIGMTSAKVNELIEQIPDEDEREDARTEWEYSVTYERMHPFVVDLSKKAGIKPEQLDAAWEEALTL